MKMVRRNYGILLILLVLFAAPGIFAYFFYMHPQWLGVASTNKGELISPPALASWGSADKWQVVLWSPTPCEAHCEQLMDKLARIRLALGRHWYNTEQWLVLNEDAPYPTKLADIGSEQNIHIIKISAKERAQLSLPVDATLFIANPKHYLVLRFATTAQSDDIFHDLKQLMMTNQQSK